MECSLTLRVAPRKKSRFRLLRITTSTIPILAPCPILWPDAGWAGVTISRLRFSTTRERKDFNSPPSAARPTIWQKPRGSAIRCRWSGSHKILETENNWSTGVVESWPSKGGDSAILRHSSTPSHQANRRLFMATLRYVAFLSQDPATLVDFYHRFLATEELGRSPEGDISITDGYY